MATRTITIHDRCTIPTCNRVLMTILEGERGTCSTCWFKSLSPETHQSLKRVIKSAFDGSSETERNAAVDDAITKLREIRRDSQ